MQWFGFGRLAVEIEKSNSNSSSLSSSSELEVGVVCFGERWGLKHLCQSIAHPLHKKDTYNHWPDDHLSFPDGICRYSYSNYPLDLDGNLENPWWYSTKMPLLRIRDWFKILEFGVWHSEWRGKGLPWLIGKLCYATYFNNFDRLPLCQIFPQDFTL